MEWGMNPQPSDYEADMLIIWLKAWAASQAASLHILTGILHFCQPSWNAAYMFGYNSWPTYYLLSDLISEWILTALRYVYFHKENKV